MKNHISTYLAVMGLSAAACAAPLATPPLAAGSVPEPGTQLLHTILHPSLSILHSHLSGLPAPILAQVALPEEPAGTPSGQGKQGLRRDALVVIGKSVELAAEDTADAVVAIGGSVTIHGKVTGAAVAIAGNVTVHGEVKDAAVAVLGDVNVEPDALVRGDAVAVGGRVKVAEGGTVQGGTQEVDFGMLGISTPEWLRLWFVECVLKLRPMAPNVGWLWGVAGGFFLFYFLVALLFPRPVRACAEEFIERPATTFLMGLLTKILVPVVFVILAATGIGLVVIPFLCAALIFAGIIGKVALLQAMGVAAGRQLNNSLLQKPLIGFFLGAIFLLVLYMVPVLGLVAFSVAGVWSIGGVVTATFGGLRREIPPKTGGQQAGPPGLNAGLPPSDSAAFTAPAGDASMASPSQSLAPTGAVPPVTELVSHPRASFWERMGAGFLDTVLVSILSAVVGGPPLGFLVALAYFAGMWAWKGTTIGGIVLGLKVVRLDGAAVTFPVALVRGLAAAFSVVVLFLGFLWIAWDKDKQGWHDKIAGTLVLKLPRGTPLVCF
jgi:uncharacterized RDD family membrane protein YckC